LQAGVLGRGGDIQRAIKMYGRIGGLLEHQKTNTGYVQDKKVSNSERTMWSLFRSDMLGTTQDLLEDVLFVPSNVVGRVFGFVNAHKILLFILIMSICFNFFLSGRSTAEYWHIRNAEKLIQRAGVKPNDAVVRMISLKEIDDLVASGLGGLNATESGLWYNTANLMLRPSYEKFAELYALDDLADSNYDTSPQYTAPIARQKASKLRTARQQLGTMRHQFLASLSAVNAVEKELVEAEWTNWLSEELYQCDRAAQLLSRSSEEVLSEKAESISKIREYCANCNDVWETVKERFTERS
jgi:hypothetical protein